MACDLCGSKRGHLPGCPKWGKGQPGKTGPTVRRGKPKMRTCSWCGGSGKNRRGRDCIRCGGSGEVEAK